MNSEDALTTFLVGIWIVGILCVTYSILPSPWRHVGYIRYHGDQQRLYERIAYGRREWRYTVDEHNVYPSSDILYIATDIHGGPLN